MLVLSAIILSTISLTATLPLPSYIKACSKSDPNFKQCAVDSANNAFPEIAKGDKKYGIISVLPLVIPELTLSSPNMVIKFRNLNVYGIENSTVTDLEWNTEQKKVKFATTVERVLYKGDYEIDGHILVFPIKGSGKAEIEYYNGKYMYDLDLDIITKDGVEYARIVNPTCDYKASKIHYQLGNLFNGDEKLGAELNKVLNENWEVVDNDLHTSIAKTNGEVCSSIANGIISKVPYKDLILD